MTAVGSEWEWQATLPEGLDESAAKVYRQTANRDVVQIGGEHHLFPDGQVWWRRDGRWRRSIVPAEDLNGPLFEPVTA